MSLPPPLPETPPPLCIEHRVRVSALEKECAWKLDGDTLWIATEGRPDIPIPLAGIVRLRLSYDPSRFQTNRFRCHLYNANGKCGVIQNDSYRGMADFEDRSESYVALVRALIPRIASLSPRCTFRSGTSNLNWWVQAIFLLGVFSLLFLVMFALYTAIGPLVIVKLVIIAFFVPVAIRWFLRNKPKAFDPQEIPDAMLPK